MVARILTLKRAGVIVLAMSGLGWQVAMAQQPIQRVTLSPPNVVVGFPTDAVVVKRGDLVHSGQFFAQAKKGQGDAGFVDLLGKLRSFCERRGGTLAEVVKLNLYLAEARPETVAEIGSAVRQAWPEGTAPAVTLVHSGLPGGASLSGDVVMRKDSGKSSGIESSREAATMPAGRDILYVSGRAAREGTLAEATAGTMEQLLRVIGELGSSAADVIQVKAFLQTMGEWESAQAAMEAAFAGREVPPIVLVEWTSSLPTEIELIAAAPEKGERSGETVTFFTPEGDKASPVFSRVARVHADTLIYTGGLSARVGEEPLPEMKRVFARLNDIAQATGSDLAHLAKATYYVSDDTLSKTLNEIRPNLYDPERPPAASKVAVSSIGEPGAGLLMDFIAVPSK